jgi:glycosidase
MLLSACDKSEMAIATQVVNHETPFVPPALEDMVMYEINPTAFSTTKDIQGIQARLDSLKSLGVNIVWIMPIFPVGQVNSFGSPYCVRNYKEVNPSRGTFDQLKVFVQEAHSRNMAVILDWVANHTSWDNVWMTHHDWYTQDANGNILHPAGTTWTDVADLNFDNAEMRLAMIDAMSFWVKTADIDGFRCDAADYVPFDFWKQANDSLRLIPNKQLIMLAEGARADHFTAGFQLNFSWTFMGTLKNVFAGTQTVNALNTASVIENNFLPANCRKLRFSTNHDESNISTPVTVYGGMQGALAASVLSTFMQGVPLFYCGQEVGVNSTSVYNGTNTINWQQNPTMLANYKKIIAFYKHSNAARKGNIVTNTHPTVAGFTRTFETDTIAIIVNTRNTQQSYDVPSTMEGTWKNAMNNDAPMTLNDVMTMGAYQFYILEK